MISAIVSRLVILLFGTLYPAYASYKAVRTKNVKEYVKWMMYWIVFAFFTFIETFTDILLSWFPFYYEIKVIVVLWLLSPATRGSSTLYRKFVHPMLTRREQEIDDYINQAKEKGYTAVLQLGSKGVNYATNVIMQTAIKVLGTKTDTTPFGSMMRISQSDNSLLMTAAAVAARASAADTFSSGSGSVTMRTNGLTTNYSGVTSGEDEADGGSLMAIEAEQQPQYSASTTGATSAGRVRRSQSVDSALNRGGQQHGLARSTTSRSMTRSRAAAGLQQHAVIYEMDSEDEERFLATETDLILGTTTSTTTTTNAARIRGRTRAITSVSASEESDGTESGASRTLGVTGKGKQTVKDTGRAKKTGKGTGTTTKLAGGTRTAPGGRRKANATEVDSGRMDVE